MKIFIKSLCSSVILGSMMACSSQFKNKESDRIVNHADSAIFKLRDIDQLKIKEDSFIKAGDKYNELLSKLAIGRRYRELSHFDNALEYHQAAFDLASQLRDTLEMMNSSLQLGTNFRRIGNGEEASRYLYHGLHLYENYSDKNNLSVNKAMVSILNGLGNVEQELGNSRESINLFFRSLNEAKKNTPLNRAINYSNIGDSYSRMGMVDSAKYYYHLSLDANLEAKVPTGIGLGYINSGNIYKKNNQMDSAAILYNEAYSILKTTQDRWHWLISCNALSDIYLSEDKLNQAIYYIKEGLEEIKTLNSIRGARDVYYYASVYYEKNGDYKEALHYTRLANYMADSLKNEKSSDNINGLKLAYEREVSKHRTELLMEQNNNQKKSTAIIVLLCATILLLTIAVFSLCLSYIRRKGIKRLEKAYRELQIMHRRAERAEQMKSAFIQSITHEIRTPLNAIQGFGGLIIDDQYDNEKKKDFYNELERGIHNLTELVNNMLDLSNFTTGNINVQKENVKVQDILKNMAMEMNAVIPEKVIFRIDTPQEIMYIKTDEHRISQVLHNLISNACKNTKEGYIALGAAKKENIMQIYVEDTGCGVPKDMIDAIFSGFVKMDKFKQGIGIGLRLSMLICDALDANLYYDKDYTEGARFVLEFAV